MIAAKSGHLDTVQDFLAKGANLSLQNVARQTAAKIAEKAGYTEIADIIRKKIAENVTNGQQRTTGVVDSMRKIIERIHQTIGKQPEQPEPKPKPKPKPKPTKLDV